MSDDCSNGRAARAMVLWGVAVFLLCLPTGLLTGILLSLISQFGIRLTLDSIRANPQMFAKQFAPVILYSGWITVTSLAALVIIVGIELAFRPMTKALRMAQRDTP